MFNLTLSGQLNLIAVLLILNFVVNFCNYIISAKMRRIEPLITAPLAPTSHIHEINSPLKELHKIIRNDGTLIGRRQEGHPDIQEALNTPGLAVKYPDGSIDLGKQ